MANRVKQEKKIPEQLDIFKPDVEYKGKDISEKGPELAFEN